MKRLLTTTELSIIIEEFSLLRKALLLPQTPARIEVAREMFTDGSSSLYDHMAALQDETEKIIKIIIDTQMAFNNVEVLQNV